MICSEQHIVKPSHKFYDKLRDLTRKSKDLRNAALYIIRQHYFHKRGQNYNEDIASDVEKEYVQYGKVDKLLKQIKHEAYRGLPANTAQQTLKMVDKEFQGFFTLLGLKKQGLYTQKVRPPKYSKKDGYYPVVYNASEFSEKYLSKGIVKLPKTDIEFPDFIHLETMSQLRIVPKNGYIIVEVLYDVPEVEIKDDNGRYMSMDPGVGTLGAVASNVVKPFLISGGPVKSINQYFNKLLARLQSELEINKNKVLNKETGKFEQQHTSRQIERLGLKRNMKLNDYFHKASALLVQIMLSEKINTFILGHSKGWKQTTKMTHKSKEMQNFQELPFNRFFWMIEYKCRKNGIRFVEQEESYTSKASFLDLDEIPVYDKNMSKEERHKIRFSGKRVKRGLYKSSDGTLLNADVNGAYNQMRKYLKNVVCDAGTDVRPADREFVMNPEQTCVLHQKIKQRSRAEVRKTVPHRKKAKACSKKKSVN